MAARNRRPVPVLSVAGVFVSVLHPFSEVFGLAVGLDDLTKDGNFFRQESHVHCSDLVHRLFEDLDDFVTVLYHVDDFTWGAAHDSVCNGSHGVANVDKDRASLLHSCRGDLECIRCPAINPVQVEPLTVSAALEGGQHVELVLEVGARERIDLTISLCQVSLPGLKPILADWYRRHVALRELIKGPEVVCLLRKVGLLVVDWERGESGSLNLAQAHRRSRGSEEELSAHNLCRIIS